MSIQPGNYKIYGNLDPNQISVNRPLTVRTKREGEFVETGDEFHFEVFKIHAHGSNLYSFELLGANLFVRPDQGTNLLMLGAEVQWDVSDLGKKHDVEVMHGLSINDNGIEKIWDMNIPTLTSRIRLSIHEDPYRIPYHLKGHKWKFKQVV